ncbi:MAG: serine hydrolase domain-containing protein [Rhodothermaceae bacterium]
MSGFKIYKEDKLNFSNEEKVKTLQSELKNRFGPVKAMLIVDKDNNKILEHSRRDFFDDSLVQIMAASNSIASLLIGIAIEQGMIKSVNQTMKELLPEEKRNQINEKDDITLEHLLTMTSGLNWPPPIVDFYPHEEDIRIVNDLQIVTTPGEKFKFSPDIHLTMCILEEASGMKLGEFAEKYLFAPLGIDEFFWELSYAGYQGIYCRIQDFAKLGTLVLKKGNWNGTQIVNEKYLEEALTKKVFGEFPEINDYGYHWWVTESNGLKLNYASGFGGQYLFVVPELEVVVAIISENDRAHLENKELVLRYVLS